MPSPHIQKITQNVMTDLNAKSIKLLENKGIFATLGEKKREFFQRWSKCQKYKQQIYHR